jgi:hypothetical protein
LEQACESFKLSNEWWEAVECIMVDKDFTEMAVLGKAFPNARVLLCEWHVKKYLRKEIYDQAKYGFSTFEKIELENCVRILVDAASADEYDQCRVHVGRDRRSGKAGEMESLFCRKLAQLP